MILQVAGWVGAAIAVGSFGWASWTGRFSKYHYWNITSAVILVPTDIIAGAPFAAAISLFYGAASVVAIARHGEEA